MKKTIFFVAFAFYSGTTLGMFETNTSNTCKRNMSPITARNSEDQNKKIKLSEIEFTKDMRDFKHFNPPFMKENPLPAFELVNSPLIVDNEEHCSQEQFDQLFNEYINLDQVDQSKEKMQLEAHQQMLIWNLKHLSTLDGQNFAKACQFGIYFPNLKKLTINTGYFSSIRGSEVAIPRLAELKVIGQIPGEHELNILLSMLKESLMKLEINVNNLQYLQSDKLNLRNLRALKLTGSSISEEESRELEKPNAHLSGRIKFQAEKISSFLLNLSLSLRILEFSGARLTGKSKKLMYSTGELLGLTYLNLSKNRFTAIPKALKNLKDLIHLDFSDNKIKIGIPEWMTSLSNLTYLDLSKNNITTIPETIETFEKLTYLNLSLNCIRRIPNNLWNLKKLSHLDLSGNNISTISPMIKKAENLTHLNIANNHVTDLPESIRNLSNLTHLDLFGNKDMKFLPISIIYMSNLRHLDIRYTSIITLPRFYWWNLVNLREMRSSNLSNPRSYLYSFEPFQYLRNTQKNRK